jgi:DNA-binding PadR family transcriptional regulator
MAQKPQKNGEKLFMSITTEGALPNRLPRTHTTLVAPMEARRFCVLLALTRKSLSAAAIQQQILTDNQTAAVYIKLPTLLKILDHLVARQAIEQQVVPRSRTIYAITPHGRRLLRFESHRLEEAARLARKLLAL